ncbi:hypothetical protein PoB_004692800 [Plakobranchus ocellatus]|uniref:Uncharacterized protein n=1 Tax=Plakobranchus ocellatus TaxID=259542 RepID=A0AAV4BLI8_9GAST|nr:hypothetical protein PoB_004692800 [Plakobranchus ocellatus]
MIACDYATTVSELGKLKQVFPTQIWGVGGTVASESALRPAVTLLSRVRAPLWMPWPVGGLKDLRSPCCGQAIKKNPPRGYTTSILREKSRVINIFVFFFC